jgi:hypothetical protein
MPSTDEPPEGRPPEDGSAANAAHNGSLTTDPASGEAPACGVPAWTGTPSFEEEPPLAATRGAPGRMPAARSRDRSAGCCGRRQPPSEEPLPPRQPPDRLQPAGPEAPEQHQTREPAPPHRREPPGPGQQSPRPPPETAPPEPAPPHQRQPPGPAQQSPRPPPEPAQQSPRPPPEPAPPEQQPPAPAPAEQQSLESASLEQQKTPELGPPGLCQAPGAAPTEQRRALGTAPPGLCCGVDTEARPASPAEAIELLLFNACHIHASELLLQLGHLVADAGGELELEFAGGGQHLVVEVLDQLGQFGAGHAGAGGG